MTYLEQCQTCQLYLAQQKICQLMIPQMQGKIQPTDFCSQHMKDIPLCETCGAGVLTPFIEVIGDTEYHVYCPNCINQKRLQQDMQYQTQNS